MSRVRILILGYLCVGLLAVANQSVWAQEAEEFMDSASAAREGEEWGESDQREQIVKPQVSFPANTKDPTLSPDDVLLLKYREKQRLAAEEAERKRKAEAERKRLAEEEKKRQWELLLLKDPTILIRDKIHIGGIIDKEVLIGNKLYTVGNTYMGAKIVSVNSDSVTFSYKGHKFVRKVKI